MTNFVSKPLKFRRGHLSDLAKRAAFELLHIARDKPTLFYNLNQFVEALGRYHGPGGIVEDHLEQRCYGPCFDWALKNAFGLPVREDNQEELALKRKLYVMELDSPENISSEEARELFDFTMHFYHHLHIHSERPTESEISKRRMEEILDYHESA